jgi:hypothetical protein
MNKVHAVASHWAVLIGINNVKGPLNALGGCIRDVQRIKKYLEARSTTTNIDTFTASAPSDPNSRHPPENPDSWPTRENVASSLRRIIDKAKPGDFVYIHYSGMGVRMEGTSNYSDENTGNLALVLFDDVNGSYNLSGRYLADYLNKMLKKGLFVTLVLDCSFSGGVVLPKWLVDPDGYTIFTACGPHEMASELTVEGESHGALSYLLVRVLTALRKRGLEITNQSLYQHLRVQFHASWQKQNPMCYGNKNFSFFGNLRAPDMAFTSVFMTQGCLCLDAGHAHGVCEGDEYAVYPPYTPEDVFNDTTKAAARVRVDVVRGLISDLVGIEPMSILSQVKTGWKARPLIHLSPRKVHVLLRVNTGNQAQWRAAAKRRRFLHLSTEDEGVESVLFNVIRNKRNEYEILDHSCEKIISLPTIPFDEEGALDRVMDILEHLATFKYFEAFENRMPSLFFEDSFTIHLSDATRNDLGTAGFLDVKHQDVLNLTVENKGTEPLYLAIFDLGPSWQIDNLLCPNRTDTTRPVGKIPQRARLALIRSTPRQYYLLDRLTRASILG